MGYVIDPDACVGCESCVEVCPELFEMEGDIAIVKDPAAEPECGEEAMDMCPEDAITHE